MVSKLYQVSRITLFHSLKLINSIVRMEKTVYLTATLLNCQLLLHPDKTTLEMK